MLESWNTALPRCASSFLTFLRFNIHQTRHDNHKLFCDLKKNNYRKLQLSFCFCTTAAKPSVRWFLICLEFFSRRRMENWSTFHSRIVTFTPRLLKTQTGPLRHQHRLCCLCSGPLVLAVSQQDTRTVRVRSLKACLLQERQLLCNYKWHLTAACVT